MLHLQLQKFTLKNAINLQLSTVFYGLQWLLWHFKAVNICPYDHKITIRLKTVNTLNEGH
jgi:hypothetical protein